MAYSSAWNDPQRDNENFFFALEPDLDARAGDDDEESGSGSEPAEETTTTTEATTTTTQPTTTTTARPTTTRAPTPEDRFAATGSGKLCADLAAVGYSFADAAAYWEWDGRPDRMDADLNGVPCETVYSAEEVNALLKAASEQSPVLGYNSLPLVSCDFNHNPLSSIVDANHTKASGKLLKVMAWYDNEWGFSNRMLDNCRALARLM